MRVVRSDGDSVRTLVPRGDGAAPRAVYVDWSEDGRTVYYLAIDPAGADDDLVGRLGGGTPRLLVRFDDPTREWHRFGFKIGAGGSTSPWAIARATCGWRTWRRLSVSPHSIVGPAHQRFRQRLDLHIPPSELVLRSKPDSL